MHPSRHRHDKWSRPLLLSKPQESSKPSSTRGLEGTTHPLASLRSGSPCSRCQLLSWHPGAKTLQGQPGHDSCPCAGDLPGRPARSPASSCPCLKRRLGDNQQVCWLPHSGKDSLYFFFPFSKSGSSKLAASPGTSPTRHLTGILRPVTLTPGEASCEHVLCSWTRHGLSHLTRYPKALGCKAPREGGLPGTTGPWKEAHGRGQARRPPAGSVGRAALEPQGELRGRGGCAGPPARPLRSGPRPCPALLLPRHCAQGRPEPF